MNKAPRVALLGMVALALVALVGIVGGGPATTAVAPYLTREWIGALAVVAVLLGLLAPPLAAAAKLLAWTGDSDPHRPTVTLATIGLWNGAILALLLSLMPESTMATIASEPEAPVPEFVALEAIEPVDFESMGPVAPVEPEVFAAADIFRFRAPAVVIVETQTVVDESGMVGELAKRMGLERMDGHGSGFAVSEDGRIVTNHHVIQGADHLTVVTQDGRRLPVQILAEDPDNDLALLKVQDAGLPWVELAATPPGPGAKTFAIGAPLGLDYTLTEGIISAHRTVGVTEFLQMQTPVAPGSSGGPLFDDVGKVVGVNTATAGGGSMNLAVQAGHVADLVAGPVNPRPVEPTEPGLRVTEITTDGFEIHPTDRMSLEQVAGYFGNALSACFDDAPAEPVNLTIASRGVHVAGLEGDALSCVEKGAAGFGPPLHLVLRFQLDVPVGSALTVRYDSGLVVTVALGS